MLRRIFNSLLGLAKNETFIWCTNIVGILAMLAVFILPRTLTLISVEDAADAYVRANGWRTVTWKHCDTLDHDRDGLVECRLFGERSNGDSVSVILYCDDAPALRLNPKRCENMSQ